MRVDYTGYEPGVALARDVILAVCPKCGKPGQVQELSKETVIVHEVSIEWRQPSSDKVPTRKKDGTYNPLRGRWEAVPTRGCRYTAAEWESVPAEQKKAANWRTYVCMEAASA